MITPAKFQAKAENTARDLSDIQKEIKQARLQLESTAGTYPSQQEQAEKIAGRLLVLEAREKSTKEAIKANEREAAKFTELLNSKEYQDAQKQIAELETYFTREADEVCRELTVLRERIQADLVKHWVYWSILDRFCLDLDTISKSARARSPEYLYLLDVHTLLSRRHELDERIHTAEQRHAELIAARAKPAGFVEAVKQVFNRNTDSKEKPIIGTEGKP